MGNEMTPESALTLFVMLNKSLEQMKVLIDSQIETNNAMLNMFNGLNEQK